MSCSLVTLFLFSYAGVSRSASLVIAFVMKENSWRFEEAHKFVKSKRSCVFPNIGFLRSLKQYELKLGLINEEQLEKEPDEKLDHEKYPDIFSDYM
jgi:protein-tyrosine phosphatase